MIDPERRADAAAPDITAVPGVVAVHDPRPLIARAVRAGADAIGSREPVAEVIVSDAGATLATAISVSSRTAAPDVARTVADLLLTTNPAAERVSVQVRRIALG